MLKRIYLIICLFICSTIICVANNVGVINTDSVYSHVLQEVSVTSLYRNSVNTGSLLKLDKIKKDNHGQEPAFLFAKMPNIFAYNDGGTQFGYSYFRIRGMGQERMNVTLDGMPWNEAEDFGCYFSNAPDLLSSMHTVKVERGASVTTNGTAAYAGNVSLESTNLKTDTLSYIDMGAGNFNTYRITGVYNMGIKNGWGFHLRGTLQQTDGFKEHSGNNSQAVTAKVGYYFNDNHYIDFLTMTGYHRNGQAYIGLTKDMIPDKLNPFKQIPNGCAPSETDNFFMMINKMQYHGILSDKAMITASVYWNNFKGDYRVLIPEDALWNYDLTQNLYGGNVISKFFLNDFTINTGINAYMFQRRHIGTTLPMDTIVNSTHGMGPELFNNIGYKPDINVFASGEYKKHNWRVKANAQYRYTSLDYKPSITYVNTDVPFKHTWNFFNCGASIDYTFNNYGMIYARYALTHREPSRVDMFGGEYYTGELFASTQTESVNDIEIGYDIAYKRINANINLFYMKFNNEMVATGEISSNNGLPLHTQNNSYRTGIELSADWNIFNNFHFIGNAAWSSNKIIAIDENGDSYKNNNTYSPDFLLYAEINNKFKHNWTIGISTNYRTKMYVDISNEHTLPAAFNLNAYVMKTFSKFDISLHMNNLTNRLNMSAGYVADNIMYYQVDAPFNFFINCKINF